MNLFTKLYRRLFPKKTTFTPTEEARKVYKEDDPLPYGNSLDNPVFNRWKKEDMDKRENRPPD